MKKATHPQVIEYCELRGIDHTNNDRYNCAKGELEMFINMRLDQLRWLTELNAQIGG